MTHGARVAAQRSLKHLRRVVFRHRRASLHDQIQVVAITSGQSQCSIAAAHMDGSVVFTRMRQCAHTYFIGPLESKSQTASRYRFSRFAQLTAERPYTLRWTAPQTCPLLWGISTPSNRPTWFLRPTRVLNPNDISIGSAVFAGLTTVTDRRRAYRPTNRPTDHATRSVTIGRMYIYVVRRCGL